MATAVLTNTPTIITTCESTTGWSGDTFILDPLVKVQGSNSVSCAMTTNGTNNIQFATSSAPGGTFAVTNIHIRFWFYLEFIGDIASLATNGIQIQVVSTAGTALYTVSGSDVYDGGWVQAVVYTGNTPTSGSTPSGTCTAVGLTVNTNTKPRNVPSNCYVDAIYFGDGYTVTGGTSGDEIDWSHIAALDRTNRYGIVTNIDGVYFLAGDITIGTATTTWFLSGQKAQFRDSGGIATFSSTLFGVTFAGSGLRLDITGGAWGASGTQDYLLDVSDTGITSVSIAGVQFARANSVLFASGQTISNCVFSSCGQVDPSTSTFSGMTFADYVGTSGALLFPTNDSNISTLTFINCDNGVEYDASSDATSPSFNNFQFDDAAGNYDVNNTSGGAVTINKNNGSNPNSYNPAGDIVTFAGASVTTLVTVRDIDTTSVVVGARVLLEVSNSANFPYLASVTITGSGTTATVAHTGHGYSSGQYVVIRGAVEDVYNGQYSITVTGVNEYTYTANETIGSSPATGTITANTVIISGITNGSGQISDTRQYGTDQPITGWVRKATTGTLYRQQPVTDTISSSTGLTLTVLLINDEA